MENLGPGRIVHFVVSEGQHLPMIVTRVLSDAGAVDGVLFGDAEACRIVRTVHYSGGREIPGMWHWPRIRGRNDDRSSNRG